MVQSKILLPLTLTQGKVTTTTYSVTFDSPLLFSNFAGGFVIETDFHGYGATSTTSGTFVLNCKNSSNATVDISLVSSSTSNQAFKPYTVSGAGPTYYMHHYSSIFIKSDGSGTFTIPYRFSAAGMSNTLAFTSSAITQIIGVTLRFTTTNVYTGGGIVTARGIN